MTSFLHIGMAKTGTTTIQHFLMNHRAALAERGYLFPRTFGSSNHEALSVYACGFGPGFSRHKRPDLATEGAFDAWCRETEEGFLSELSAAQPQHIVLSNEHIFEHVRGPERIGRLLTLLETAGQPVKVIVYLRRPDAFMASFYAESVRMGYDGWPEDLMATPRTERMMAYRDTVFGWADAVGDENVAIRVFEPKRLAQGDALADFGSLVGLDPYSLAGSQTPERRRDALDAYQTNFLRNFNAAVLRAVKAEPHRGLSPQAFRSIKVRGPIVRMLLAIPQREKFRLPRAQAVAMIERYAETNRQLFERFGIEGFDPADPPDSPPLSSYFDPEVAFESFAKIWTSEAARGRERPVGLPPDRSAVA